MARSPVVRLRANEKADYCLPIVTYSIESSPSLSLRVFPAGMALDLILFYLKLGYGSL
jgi:hypothetical protein